MTARRDPGGPLADTLLVVEASRVAAARSDAPNGELDRLLREVTARTSSRTERVTDDDELAARADRARRTFASWLEKESLLAAIVTRAGLSDREAEVLAFLVAVELDPERQKLVAYIQDDPLRVRPTLATIRRIFGRQGVLAIAAHGPLRLAGLVTVDESTSWATQVVTVAPSVTWALIGDGSLDPALPAGARAVSPPSATVDGDLLVLVVGPDRARRLEAAYAATVGGRFLVTPVPTTTAEWEAVVREAIVGGLGVVLEVAGELSEAARWWLEHAIRIPWALSSPTELPLDQLPKRPWIEVRGEAPEASRADWEAALGEGVDHHGHRLSAQQLSLVSEAMPGLDGDLDATVRRLASGPLDKLARRIRPRRSWDDLILTGDRLAQLHDLCARYRQRDVVYNEWGFPMYPSIGLVALFSGVSGTGKTLAAEVIAGDLGLDLFKLDLSSMVSKYIGETEKNLEEVFTASSGGNLVLFFDEADAVFGKRAEVNDARDRYANLEVSYLLQRIESYDGIVVLATNFQRNIDEAFLRRIHVNVDFAMPEQPERERIWRHALPPTAPCKDIDYDFLAAQFKISGGNITSAALSSAFLAAEANEPITMESIVIALKREFQKLGRLRTEAEFGQYTELVTGRPQEAR